MLADEVSVDGSPSSNKISDTNRVAVTLNNCNDVDFHRSHDLQLTNSQGNTSVDVVCQKTQNLASFDSLVDKKSSDFTQQTFDADTKLEKTSDSTVGNDPGDVSRGKMQAVKIAAQNSHEGMPRSAMATQSCDHDGDEEGAASSQCFNGCDVVVLRRQLTFLTHQVSQLMQVLCIARCNCPDCAAFVSTAQLPLAQQASQSAVAFNSSSGNFDLPQKNCLRPTSNNCDDVIDGNNAVNETNDVTHNLGATCDADGAVTNDDSADDPPLTNVVGDCMQSELTSSTGKFVVHAKTPSCTEVSHEEECEESLVTDGVVLGHLQNGYSSSVLPLQRFYHNGCLVPVGSVAAAAATAAALLRSGVRRPVVGVDQLLPKLLAEQRSFKVDDDSGIVDDFDVLPPNVDEAENLTTANRRRVTADDASVGHVDFGTERRRRGAAAPLTKGVVVGGREVGAERRRPPATIASKVADDADDGAEKRRRFVVVDEADEDDAEPSVTLSSSTLAALDGRAARKRRRFLEDLDENHAAVDNSNNVCAERLRFLNGSPCSSGGSLELPKTSADILINSDMICVNGDQLMPSDLTHDRDPRFGYLSAMGPGMSAGLPLVMPGPKATTFFCTICNREFSNVYYKRHMIVHANSRPYVCDVCGKRFNERSNMMKHKQRLHGWFSFVLCLACEFCTTPDDQAPIPAVQATL